jgi:hypothetical protein
MIVYTTSFINEYYQGLENKTLNSQLLDCLNVIVTTINNDISLNIIDNDNDLRFKKTKLKSKSGDTYYQSNNRSNSYSNSYSNSNSNSHNNNNNHSTLKRKEEVKTKIEEIKSTIKSILNKLSPSNYIKLEQDFLMMYSELLTNCIESNNNETIDYIDNYIINYICYNNITYSTIYINILFSLFNMYCNKNYKIETLLLYNLLQKHYNDFIIFDNIIKCSSLEDNDEFVINKNNDKYKCFIIFIINFYKKIYLNSLELKSHNTRRIEFYEHSFSNISSLTSLFILFNKFFIKNLELENNKTYCETIQEFLIIFYTELFKDSKFIKIVDCDCKLLDDIKLLLLNNSEYPSFTNKIKFKLMNIRDKYEVLSNS